MRMSRPNRSRPPGFSETARPPRIASRRAVNLSVPGTLVDEARALGINLSETLEAALHTRLRAARESALREELRPAIDAFNEDFDRNGLWSDGIRPW